MHVGDALGYCGGAASAARLLQVGVSPHGLRVARLEGFAVGHGAFALPDAPPALVAAARLNGVVSYSSAAALYGFPSWRQDKTIHVTVAGGARRLDPDVRIHRARIRPDEIHSSTAITTPLRTLLDCGRSMPLVEAVVVMDGALRGGRVSRDALQAAADAARGHGAAALRQAVRWTDALADSPMESVLRVVVSILNCTVRSQVRLRGVRGPVDFVLDGWLALEADGFEFYSGRSDYRRDRAKANALAARGLVLLRFTYEDLQRPGWVLGQVAQVLALGPPRR